MIDQNSSNLPKPSPTTIIIFGASGDLTQRKLIPALYTLNVEGHLPPQFAVVGVARTEYDDDAFRRPALGRGERAREQRQVDQPRGRRLLHISITVRATMMTRPRTGAGEQISEVE